MMRKKKPYDVVEPSDVVGLHRACETNQAIAESAVVMANDEVTRLSRALSAAVASRRDGVDRLNAQVHFERSAALREGSLLRDQQVHLGRENSRLMKEAVDLRAQVRVLEAAVASSTAGSIRVTLSRHVLPGEGKEIRVYVTRLRRGEDLSYEMDYASTEGWKVLEDFALIPKLMSMRTKSDAPYASTDIPQEVSC
jgi:hypothetical protein